MVSLRGRQKRLGAGTEGIRGQAFSVNLRKREIFLFAERRTLSEDHKMGGALLPRKPLGLVHLS